MHWIDFIYFAGLISSAYGGVLEHCNLSKDLMNTMSLFYPPNLLRASAALDLLKNGTSEFLFSGSSITAMGYFSGFVRWLNQENITVKAVNRGHGATDIMYALHCVDFRNIQPSIVFAEFKVSDWYKRSDLMEALMMKFYHLGSLQNQPLIVFVNFNVKSDNCSTPVKFFDIASFHGAAIIDLCPIIRHCFGTESTWPLYSVDDIHPNGPDADHFLTTLFKHWWADLQDTLFAALKGSKPVYANFSGNTMLYKGLNGETRCDTANDDASNILKPQGEPAGFKQITRIKSGASGFHNIKRCWEGLSPGDHINFPFYGQRLSIAIYQKPAGMGVFTVYVDEDSKTSKNVSGFFQGYNWAPGLKEMGRQYIVDLYDNLTLGAHNLSIVISHTPANPDLPGHNVQIIALLYFAPR